MSLASTIKGLVSKTIADYGAEVTFQRVSSVTYDAATSRAVPVTTSGTIKAVIARRASSARNDGLASSGVLEVLISAEAIADLNVGDHLSFNGSVFTCSSLTPQYFQGSLLFWTAALQS